MEFNIEPTRGLCFPRIMPLPDRPAILGGCLFARRRFIPSHAVTIRANRRAGKQVNAKQLGIRDHT